ncbi:MAG: UvrD-helicase domain-containing protein [Planctomycetes bacterium]|nr:UvrD-helicase domain-containing protein [Planctomycetota bacterium]
MDDILAILNERQREAVLRDEGPILVVAGPGTGKTRVLVHRIAYLIAARGADPASILAVTFTNRAARELVERIRGLVRDPAAADRVVAGTFHAISLRFLRERSEEAGIPQDFRVLDADERDALVRRVARERGVEPARLARAIPVAKGVVEGDPLDPDLAAAAAAYDAALREGGALDFDDLIAKTVALLEARPDLLEAYRRRFRHVLVDEYQDVDALQRRWVRLLAGDGRGLCAIGDPDQAIYSFRGVNVRNFLRFAEDFPGAHRIELVENFRSSETIVSASDQVIARNRERIDRDHRAVRAGGVRIAIRDFASDRAEAKWIAGAIDRLLGGVSLYSIDSGRADGIDADEEYGPGEIAVLVRLNAQARAIEEALGETGVPFERIGGGGTSLPDADVALPALDRVHLMTIHASKGLEFPVVFIAGCEDGLIPYRREGEEPDLEEERRLFYVGMTRAARRLTLTRARRRFLFGKSVALPASPFVDAIAEELREIERAARKARRRETPESDEEQLMLF